MAELKAINPDYLISMHCTGTTFCEVAKQELPGRVLLSSTGQGLRLEGDEGIVDRLGATRQ